jgi:hypothetical protein
MTQFSLRFMILRAGAARKQEKRFPEGGLERYTRLHSCIPFYKDSIAMGVDSFEQGQQNPWGLTPNSRTHDYAYQWGQQAERQRQIDLMSPPKASGPISAQASTGAAGVPQYPPRALEKSHFKAVLLCLLFGPFGMLYSSRYGALALLGGIGGLSLFAYAAKNYGALGDILSLAIPVSIVCSVIAVKLHNAKAKAYNAKLDIDWAG